MKLEICVDNIKSVWNAVKGGADRIELCSALSEGGLTPTVGFLRAAKEIASTSFPIYAMIRPRSGGFVYDETEIRIMVDDIFLLKQAAVDGFVFGILTADKKVDVNNCRILLEACRPLPVTFHRAFDEVLFPEEELEKIIELGFQRLLTSGLSKTAEKGTEMIARLNGQSNRRMIIMPGAGITPQNLNDILTATNVTEFHASAKDHSAKQIITNEDIVRQLRRIADRY